MAQAHLCLGLLAPILHFGHRLALCKGSKRKGELFSGTLLEEGPGSFPGQQFPCLSFALGHLLGYTMNIFSLVGYLWSGSLCAYLLSLGVKSRGT